MLLASIRRFFAEGQRPAEGEPKLRSEPRQAQAEGEAHDPKTINTNPQVRNHDTHGMSPFKMAASGAALLKTGSRAAIGWLHRPATATQEEERLPQTLAAVKTIKAHHGFIKDVTEAALGGTSVLVIFC